MTMLRAGVLAGLLIMGAVPAWTQGAGAAGADVRAQFAHPAKQYRPLVRWWWPGNDVTEQELRREVDALDKAGFGGAEIQPFSIGLAARHLPAADIARVNEYPSASFFKHVAAALDQAKKDGLFVDYTFGSGWPFGGGPEITPELSSVELRSSHVSVAGPGHFHGRLQMPSPTDGHPEAEQDAYKGLPAGWAERAEKRSKTVAVMAVRGNDTAWDRNQVGTREQFVFAPGALKEGTAVNLTAQMSADGTLDWDVPEGTWQVFVFRSVPTLHKLLGGVGAGPQLEMDHFSSAAFATHAARVGDSGLTYLQPYLGNTLRGIFCDSLEVKANLYWSDDFPAEFRKRRGYELWPYLPVLKVQGYGNPFGEYDGLPAFDLPHAEQVRRDYQQTISDLMIERFFNPFNAWAHAHHLLARTQAHGAPADILRIYGEADIPETEDLLDEGRYDFLKMAASGAHLYGRSIVGSESFVWRNAVYQTTPEKMKTAGDELLTAGVNAILYHGFPYLLPNVPAPGWHPFSGGPGNSHSSAMNELNPMWPYLAQLNAYFTRLQYMSQTSKAVADVAVFREEFGHAATEVPKPMPAINRQLMAAGYNYDHMNADALERSHVEAKELVTPGAAHYRALIFDGDTRLPSEVLEKVATFAKAGLPVFFGGAIAEASDSFADDATGARSAKAAAALRGMRSVVSVDGGRLVAALQQRVPAGVQFAGEAMPYLHLRRPGMNAYFVRNATDQAVTLDARFSEAAPAELWDAWSGGIVTIEAAHREGDGTRVKVALEPFESALVVFDTGRKSSPPGMQSAPGRVVRVQNIAAEGWAFKAEGTFASTAGSRSRAEMTLVDWSLDTELKTFTGHATYTKKVTLTSTDRGDVWLNLGNVREVARVRVNGIDAGTVLLRPYRLSVSKWLRAGENTIEVEVTNTLFNSMVARTPRTFNAGRTENPSGLMSGGLLGPVRLEVYSQQ